MDPSYIPHEPTWTPPLLPLCHGRWWWAVSLECRARASFAPRAQAVQEARGQRDRQSPTDVAPSIIPMRDLAPENYGRIQAAAGQPGADSRMRPPESPRRATAANGEDVLVCVWRSFRTCDASTTLVLILDPRPQPSRPRAVVARAPQPSELSTRGHWYVH